MHVGVLDMLIDGVLYVCDVTLCLVDLRTHPGYLRLEGAVASVGEFTVEEPVDLALAAGGGGSTQAQHISVG